MIGPTPRAVALPTPLGWSWKLTRPLAADEHRARFWVRHLRLGVVLTVCAAVLVLTYAHEARRPHERVLLALGTGVLLVTPTLLALPMHRMCRDGRGVLVFYGWSVGTCTLVCTLVVLDGGGASPYAWLLTLALLYAGLAYPPAGVVLMGALVTSGYLLAASTGSGPRAGEALVAGTLVLQTVMTAWISRNLWDMADQQALLAHRLATLADTDPLTMTLNRRAFQSRLQDALAAAGPEHPVSLCLLDLDGFKQVNDRYGHAAGDRVLVATGRALAQVSRETDTISRLGGDEFAVVLAATGAAEARATATRLQAALREALDEPGLRGAEVTASIGVVTSTGECLPSAVLALADQRMYEAKQAGRDQVRA